jgi:hypothetical protein
MRPVVTSTVLAALAAAAFGAGCGSPEPPRGAALQASVPGGAPQPTSPREPELVRPRNTQRLDADDLLDRLADARIAAEDRGPARIDVDDLSRFPEEPRSVLCLRLSDGQGNAETMTFVEFGSWKTAAHVDAEPINGFAVRNWFVLGIVSEYFAASVAEALDG